MQLKKPSGLTEEPNVVRWHPDQKEVQAQTDREQLGEMEAGKPGSTTECSLTNYTKLEKANDSFSCPLL